MLMKDIFDDSKKTYTSENLVKVRSSELQIGMFVAELDRPWLETPFLVQGFEIRHRSQVATIGQYCDHVFVLREGVPRKIFKPDQSRSWTPPRRENTGTLINQGAGKKTSKSGRRSIVRSRPAYDVNKPIREEHPVARRAYGKGKLAVQKLLRSAQIGQMLDTAVAEEVVATCVDSIVRNPDAMIWMSKIKHEHEYTAEHCLNVCILAIAFGRYLNFEEHELQRLGLCGLLHDVGKMRVPAAILDKVEKLTSEELRILQDHTVAGHKLLVEIGHAPPLAADVALNHHERPDGGGYPRQLAADEVSEYARIISVVDAYDAMTSDRCYSRAKSPVEAQKILYENRGTQFDEECALQFMQAIGPYPPGTWVELRNGMVGVVLAGRRKFRHLPRVILVLNKEKQQISRKTLDLTLIDDGGLDKSFLIKKALKDGTHGLRLEDLRPEVEAAS